MASSGDKLYHEFMTENKFEYLLRHNYNLAVLLNTYLISIENYSIHYTFSSGIQYKKGDSFNFEGRARRKTNVELFNDNGIYNLQMNKKYYYTFTFKK